MKRSAIARSALLLGLVVLCSLSAGAQQSGDIFGFGSRRFYIQSAAALKTSKGFFDLPGREVGKDDKGNDRLLQVFEMRDNEIKDVDHTFVFADSREKTAGAYKIRFASESKYGLRYAFTTGKIESTILVSDVVLKYVGDAKWKIYSSDGKRVFALDKKEVENRTRVVLKEDQNTRFNEWVFFDAATKKAFVPAQAGAKPAPAKSGAGPVDLTEKFENRDARDQYLQRTAAPDFARHNAGKAFQSYYASLPVADQWTAIMETVNAASQNGDAAARRAFYQALSEVEFKSADSMPTKLLQGSFRSSIGKKASEERDPVCQRLLRSISERF